jgi:cytochrome P450
MAGAHISSLVINPDRDPEEVAREKELGKKFMAYIDNLLDERRHGANDGDDLISVISRAELDGKPLSRGVAVVFMTHFLSSGETTRTLLSHMSMELAERPDQRRLLVETPDLIGNAVDETLRYAPINWSGCRTALQDVEIGGQQIKEGDYVLMAYPSGNRDEDVWDRPNEYDVTRVFDKDHLGFGHGEHSCPGALLTRIFARQIYERVLARFPDWEFAGTPKRNPSPFVQSMASVPLRFHA